MNVKSPKNSSPQINPAYLKQLLLEGNIFESANKNELTQVIHKIQIGDKKLYKQYLGIVTNFLKTDNISKNKKELMYDHVTQLAITANPMLINDLNNDFFTSLPGIYQQADGLEEYVSMWKFMYNGKKDNQDFPNVNKTLQRIHTPPSVKLSNKLSKYLKKFNQNIDKTKQKNVEFFQDFEDSSMSESFEDQSRMSEIIYMDIMELKAIRQRVQSYPLTEENCAQYIIKMKTFLNLRSNSLSGQLLLQFNKQKVWAKHFIDHNQEYLKKRDKINQQPYTNSQQIHNNSNSSGNQIVISLSKDEQSLQQPPVNFYKNKNQPKFHPKEETFGYVEADKKHKMESQIRNFTINDVPIDESRFTNRSSNKDMPAFNNSHDSRFNQDLIKENQNLLGGMNKHNQYNPFDPSYKRMSFEPKQNRKKVVKTIPISRPSPEQTLPLQESTINNMSIPQQVTTTQQIKNSLLQTQQKYKPRNDYDLGYSTNGKNNFSSSNNPFANSKTNYNLESNSKSPYEIYKQHTSQGIDMHSPIRNRMTENDLDSEQLDENIVIKPHYQTAYNKNDRNSQSQGGYANTHDNFNPKQLELNLNYPSQQKLMSQQLSPRQNSRFSQSKSKKRLSELTSQKKMRKTHATKNQVINEPDEYVYKPYALHFKRNSQGFNKFKRNSMQESFTIYASPQLVIMCSLKKINDSKLQVQVRYQNQIKGDIEIKVMYKIPKCFKIQKVSKINRKLNLSHSQMHVFNLRILEFPLEMCLLDLSYWSEQSQTEISNLNIPLSITIKNFIQILTSSKDEWLLTYEKLNKNASKTPFIICKTFELNREVIEPSEIEFILSRQFINVGAIQGYSVEQFGCICYYRNLNNLLFLVRLSIRVDHIITVEIMSENDTSLNQRDFMKYYLELLVTIMAKYSI